MKSLAILSRLLRALDRTLYKQLKSEIGRQLVILVVSPFLGINFRVPERKVGVSAPFLRTVVR